MNNFEDNKGVSSEKWSADTFNVDWSVGGEESLFASEMERSTIDALERWGNVTELKVVMGDKVPNEGEGIFYPRVLGLHTAREWFVKNDYFLYDEKTFSFKPTEKWLARFSKI